MSILTMKLLSFPLFSH